MQALQSKGPCVLADAFFFRDLGVGFFSFYVFWLKKVDEEVLNNNFTIFVG